MYTLIQFNQFTGNTTVLAKDVSWEQIIKEMEYNKSMVDAGAIELKIQHNSF